jgi:hypothetical protein
LDLVMSGFGAVAIAVLATLEAASGARTELAVGTAPVLPSGPNETSAALTLEPFAGLRFAEPDWTIVAAYDPRVFWRRPNAAALDRPIYLHRAFASHEVSFDRRTEMGERLTLAYGEIDYTASGIALLPGQTSQVDVAVLNYYEVASDVAFSRLLDRRTTLGVGVSGGESGAVDSAILPTHRQIEGGPEITRTLGRRDALAFPVTAGFHEVGDVDLVTSGGALDWTHRPSLRTETLLAAGARYASRLDDGDSNVLPLATAAVKSTLHAEGARRLDVGVALSLRPVLDVVAAVYRAIFAFESDVVYQPAPRWTTSLRTSLYTPIDPAREPRQPETTYSAEAPITWTPSPEVGLEFGVRHAGRAPHLANGFSIAQPQIWGYFALTLRESTGRDPGWLP